MFTDFSALKLNVEVMKPDMWQAKSLSVKQTCRVILVASVSSYNTFSESVVTNF